MQTFETKNNKISLFEEQKSLLKDYRRLEKGNIRHSLPEILFLTLAACVSGCNTYEAIDEFGKLKINWLKIYFPYKYNTPSHDTIGRFFAAFDPKEFAKFFKIFTQSLAKKDSSIVPIDGKTIRGVNSCFGDFPLHIVSAFCAKNRFTLCQEKVNDKSNEITAIPNLLDLLDIKNCTITIDAMGCQKNIAEKIIEKKGDYILQVKDNQQGLKEQIVKTFKRQIPKNESITRDSGHGRMEKRTCSVIDDLSFVDDKEEWVNLKTIIEIKSEIYHKKTEKKTENVRYYISSREANSKQLLEDIRQHWSIENNLHWNLDVIFKEDLQLKRNGNSAENFNMVTKLSLALLDSENSIKKSKPLKRLRASIDDTYREKIIGF
jgi:predicted transposase YbfD/YdcC